MQLCVLTDLFIKNTCLPLANYAGSRNTLSPFIEHVSLSHPQLKRFQVVCHMLRRRKSVLLRRFISTLETIQVCLTVVLLRWHNRKANISLSCASRWLPPPTLERWQAYTRTSIIIQHSKNASRRIITETWRARANPKYFTLYDCLARLSLRLPLTLTKCNVGLSESQ